MRIKFPFPDSQLNPNKRIDRRALIGVKRDAKEAAYLLTRESGARVTNDRLQLTLTFCPPDKRKRDLDNLYSAFKAYQDGLFLALGVDDSIIDCVLLQRGAAMTNGCVFVEVK